HRYPTDTRYLFGPVYYDMLNYAVLFAAAWFLMRSLSVAVAVVFGASFSQMHYQWQHYVAHRPIRPLTPWGKRMKRWHLLHHYQDANAWFGVSHPFMDWIMGTHRSKRGSKAVSFRSRKNADVSG
ncbi:MAG: sterol desaturase family protein, partial [Alicyclobacillaceae bacterium]|nr:sterol desaturase family protein [Alicyclobacillaceae bacterium]